MADEFDDLDDYLDEFDAEILAQEPGATIKNIDAEKDTIITSNNDRNQAPTTTGLETFDSSTNDQTGNLSGTNTASRDVKTELEELAQATGMDPAFTKTISDFMQQLDPQGGGNELEDIIGKSVGSGAFSGVLGEKSEEKDGGFQSTINETINRLKTSSQQAEEESTKKINNDEELLTTLLNSLDLGDDSAGGLEGMSELKELLSGMSMDELTNGATDEGIAGENVDKVSNVLLKMLNKLTSKEMMYDTVNTAVTNYEQYFKDSTNKASATKEDYERYMKQMEHLKNVKSTFDKPEYSEDNEEDRDYVDQEMENFNKLLPAPAGVVDDNLGQMGLDGMNWNDKDVPQDLEQCVQQ